MVNSSVKSEEARRRVGYVLEQMVAYCMTWQEEIYLGDTFTSPEAIEEFQEEVRVTLLGQSNLISKRLAQMFEVLDNETVS